MSEARLWTAIVMGGAFGAVARYGTGLATQALVPSVLFAGTLTANILGSFLIGLIAAWSARRFPSPLLNGLLVTGFCGGFTTFSLFSLEALTLVIVGQWGVAALYVLGSTVVWLIAVWLGWIAGQALFPARDTLN